MLNATSQYALRALVKLAQLPDNEMMSGQTLSAQCRIPANYLSKLMLVLRNSGMIEAVRGSNGGYRLGKSAREIHVADVADLFEGVKSETKCLLGKDHECLGEKTCSVHAKYSRMRLGYIEFLEKTTIAAISKKKPAKEKN